MSLPFVLNCNIAGGLSPCARFQNKLLSFRYTFLGWLKLAEENNLVITVRCTCIHCVLFGDLFTYLKITDL